MAWAWAIESMQPPTDRATAWSHEYRLMRPRGASASAKVKRYLAVVAFDAMHASKSVRIRTLAEQAGNGAVQQVAWSGPVRSGRRVPSLHGHTRMDGIVRTPYSMHVRAS
jgi:hypothetical protein